VDSYEFLVLGRPVSVNGRNRADDKRWREEVKIQAICNSPVIPPFTMPTIRLTIVFLCNGALIDTDNIIKPIQDELTGLFYGDDEMVSDVESHRRTWEDNVAADRLPLLLRKAWAERQQCVYIRVERSRNLEDLL